MKSSDFSASAPGRLVATIDRHQAFVPQALPPQIDLGAVALAMASAMQAIGELKGACRRLPNPYILVGPLQRREALTSSAMEGTYTTTDYLLLAEAGAVEQDESTREVFNYLQALSGALALLKTLPISHRVIKSAHEILLSGLSSQRGAQKRPGEYKREQNWIGGRTIDAAKYVPPPPGEAQRCMDELEAYINRPAGFPTPLIDLALVHYQLEAIHPFADGNGRVGRMLISLMAVHSGLLDAPVLYLSPAMERRKDDYIDLMYAVSSKGEWTNWLNFFFDRVVDSCHETIATIDRLMMLQDQFRAEVGQNSRSSSALTLVDYLFERPAITIPEASRRLDVTYAAAKNTIDKFVELQILFPLGDTHPRVFYAPAIVQATFPPESTSDRGEDEPSLFPEIN